MMAVVLRLPFLLSLTAAISSILISPALCWINPLSNGLYTDFGTYFTVGEYLSYRDYTFRLQSDCKLVLWKGTTAIWDSDTANKGTRCSLRLQKDGELILQGYEPPNPAKVPIWRSGKTSANGRYALVIKYDGTLHIYGPSIWSTPIVLSNFSAPEKPEGEFVPIGLTDTTLWTDDVAPIGPTITCGDYHLRLDEKCNLTLWNNRTGVAKWTSNTKDEYLQDCFVTVQGDGALMIKHLGGAALWSSGATGAYSEYVLALLQDGKLIVYGPRIWSNVEASSESAAGSGGAGMIAMVSG